MDGSGGRKAEEGGLETVDRKSVTGLRHSDLTFRMLCLRSLR